MDAEGWQLMRTMFKKIDALIDALVMLSSAMAEENDNDGDDNTYLDGTLK